MNKWIEDQEEKDLQIMCDTLKYLVNSEGTPPHTRQHAIIFLNEIEDKLWSNVTRGTPADSDQLQTSR
jgi:hypothetical protein